jgi:hypothetical protein
MIATNDYNLDEETISNKGLYLSEKNSNAPQISNTRIFEFPHLENVFVMESDLYGNPIPKDLCFLAFYGKHGLIGKYLRIETLRRVSEEEIKDLVQRHSQG